MSETTDQRCGYVAICGAPNAGKSTLLNQMVGAKVSIVTPKVQTTRARVLAIAIEGDAQIIFLDTPGVFTAKRVPERAMVDAAWRAVEDSDVVLMLVDAAKAERVDGFVDEDTATLMAGLKERRGKKALLALNKVDRVRRDHLLPMSKRFADEGVFDEIFMVSALTGDGVADLKRALGRMTPTGPWLYPEDQLAEIPERALAAEITREQAFMQLHQEVPYALAVEPVSWKEMKDGSVRIEEVIIVERESQRPIVLGKGGARIKSIGSAARAQLEKALERRVHLFLEVRVEPNWTENKKRLKALGFEIEG
ncbi:MAG TPA: GTPase Era [Caldimonas sp.]|jgi:GTP-binding protein Era|nr:GTPase Era [Caldimonas sp.]